jgi:hypothetical protein
VFKSLSFEEAIELFRQWGFGVESGPRPGEVTLIAEGDDYRTSVVYEARLLPQVAAVALCVRWRNLVFRFDGIEITDHLASPIS